MKGLNSAERNYDIYDREFLALVRALKFWRHLLQGLPYRIKVYTDHANLMKHQEAQKLSGKITQYISFLANFNFQFYHVPGKKNRVADALSRYSDHLPDEGEDATAIALPDELFVCLIRPAALEESIRRQQRDPKYVPQLKE